MEIILSGRITPLPIDFKNLSEVKEYIDLDCAGVKTITVTPENIKECRKLRAYLNGQAKRIHETLKSYIEGYMSDFNAKVKMPLLGFEKEYKEAADEVNKKIRAQERLLNPPEPEERLNVTLSFFCSEKELTKLLKAFEREGVAVNTQTEKEQINE